MHYKLLKRQIQAILPMTASVTDEIVQEALTLQENYKFNMALTARQVDVQASFYNHTISQLKTDQDSFLCKKYIRLMESRTAFKIQNFNEQITGSQEAIMVQINEVIEEYIDKNFNDLRLFIRDKQPIFERTYNAINNYLESNVSTRHGISIDGLIMTKSKDREKFLSQYLFDFKKDDRNIMEIYEIIEGIKAFGLKYGVYNPTILIQGLMFNMMNDDKDASLQKINNWLMSVEADRHDIAVMEQQRAKENQKKEEQAKERKRLSDKKNADENKAEQQHRDERLKTGKEQFNANDAFQKILQANRLNQINN
jgi:hypothetical protein